MAATIGSANLGQSGESITQKQWKTERISPTFGITSALMKAGNEPQEPYFGNFDSLASMPTTNQHNDFLLKYLWQPSICVVA